MSLRNLPEGLLAEVRESVDTLLTPAITKELDPRLVLFLKDAEREARAVHERFGGKSS